MYRKFLMSLVWILSVTASAGESIVRVSDKVFSVKHDDSSDLSIMSSNQLIDLLKSNEVHELIYSPIGVLIKKNRIKLGTWTESTRGTARIGSWTETGTRTMNGRVLYKSVQSRGE